MQSRVLGLVAWLSLGAVLVSSATISEEDCLEGPDGEKGAPLATEDQPCRMELQVTQHVIGRCTKLGRSFRGCASGPYLQPMHHDCL